MKTALIQFGTEESYGLLFVAKELYLLEENFHFFDAEEKNCLQKVTAYAPDFAFFSPMTVYYPKAKAISLSIKKSLPGCISVFGGHHAASVPEIIEENGVDAVVRGPAKGAVNRIMEGETGFIASGFTTPDDLGIPHRKTCFEDIPRLAHRYRKFMLSMPGCPWNCSYCSSASGHVQKRFGKETLKSYYLSRRPIPHLIQEAKEIISYPTYEIEWVDDDIFAGEDAEPWLLDFVAQWKKKIGLPLYVSTTSLSALRVSDNLLSSLKGMVSAIGLGIQALRQDSLKLFNRSWDNEARMKEAYNRLVSHGYSVNLQAIVGLPVEDPAEDAMETLLGLIRIGRGSICSIYPLEIYPGTKMEKYVKENGFLMNPACSGDTNTGVPSLLFSQEENKRIQNICKLGTMMVKYGMDERWIRPLLDIDLPAGVSRMLSETRYFECVQDRLKSKGEEIFPGILKSTHFRF